ncbi:MAG: hypothetical protein KDB98_00485 [Flavobacteriales bacterium]|nr:hypothetical protein [Flavobacteriales bacterium]
MSRFKNSVCLSWMLVVMSVSSAMAQEQTSTPTDSTKQKPYVVFSLGGGVTRFMGDVQDLSEKVNVHQIGNRAAYDLNIGLALSNSFILNLNAIYGKLSGNENTFGQHRNFETQMILAGFNTEYNFAGLWKKRLPVLNPFITVGGYYGNYFNISTDLMSEDGTQYHYWNNGRILDQAETGLELIDREADNMVRDYKYETSLIDGSVHTFTAAVGFGLDLHISKALSVRLMSRYFHAMNDKVDGHYSSGVSSMRDGYFFNQLSLVVNTIAFGKSRRSAEPVYKYLFDVSQLETLEQEDRDGDGVLDLKDFCANTPAGIEVDKNGCPLDKDEDGIADYKDVDPNTPKGEIVNSKGDYVDYELIESRWIDYQGARIISWDKNYSNPRFTNEDSYSVTFAVKKGEQIDEASLLKKYPKLVKKELSDSLIVFNMGTYDKFETAQEASLRTHKVFTHDAVVVNSEYINKVASDLSGVEIPDSVANRDSYGIAESIAKIKQTDSYTFPQLEYTISRFEGHLKDGVPESVLVEPYLRGIAPFTWNEVVKETYIEVNEELKQNPVAKLPATIAVESDINTEENSTTNVSQTSGQEIGSETANAGNASEEPLMAEFKLSPSAKLEFMPTTEKFKVADLNEDGLISHEEIEQVLASIVSGNSVMLVDEFNEMTALFTDFTENVDPIDFGGTKAGYVDGKLTIFKPQNTELKMDARRLLAKKYEDGDFNKDGELTPDEVQKLIALFMEGKSTYRSEQIYELIDLYFE